MSVPVHRPGFTKTEFLVLLALLAALVGLLLPAVQKARGADSNSWCQYHLMRIGLALHGYHDTFETFPPALDGRRVAGQPVAGRYWYWSWLIRIRPFVEDDTQWVESDAWAAQHDDRPFTYPAPWHSWNPWGNALVNGPVLDANPGFGKVMKLYKCPADPRALLARRVGAGANSYWETVGMTAYLGVAGVDGSGNPGTPQQRREANGILVNQQYIRIEDVPDGLSYTLMAGERPPSLNMTFGWWFAGVGYDASGIGDVVLGARNILYARSSILSPPGSSCRTNPENWVGFRPGTINDDCDQAHWWSLHPGGGNFLVGDGSVRFLTYRVNTFLPLLMARDDGVFIDF